MKFWIIPASVAMFIAGLAAGFLTRPGMEVALPRMREIAANETPATRPAISSVETVQTPTSSPVFRAGAIARPDASRLSPKMRALRMLLDRLSPERLQENLWFGARGDAALQRRAIGVFKETSDPNLWKSLTSLLDEIHNPDVAAEVLAMLRQERDPARRRYLAGLLAIEGQPDEFRWAALELLADPDPEVVRSALGGITMKRLKDPEERSRAAALMRSAAAPGKPQDLRLCALSSLRGTEEAQDIRFLLEILHTDRDVNILLEAMSSLPEDIPPDSKERNLVIECVRMLYTMAVDSARPQGVREYAAFCAPMVDFYGKDAILTEAELAFLNQVKEGVQK